MPHGASSPRTSTVTSPARAGEPDPDGAADDAELADEAGPADGVGSAAVWSAEHAASPAALSAATKAATPRPLPRAGRAPDTGPSEPASAGRGDRRLGTCGVTGGVLRVRRASWSSRPAA
jgi:hypothetical protein